MHAEVDESGLFRSKCIAEYERGARSVIALFASDGNGDFGVLQSEWIPSQCSYNGSICLQTIIEHSAAAETSLDGEERSFFYLDGLITGTNLNGTSTLNGVSSSRYLFPATDLALTQLLDRRTDARGGC
ncbi:hypothetical protein CDAR_591011 [Caerostris darwini]|uniref:Uncharacterized protein n=1 Tax=Caerostris darwini TaxID=1538125 RepID=A0AAV4PYP6_9ARAC|nr:hypothetical protein CDAR_591011 [Caerostris darwini]